MAGHFASARVERVIREAGGERVSSTAVHSLNEILTEYGMKLAKQSVAICRHAGRKTVKGDDIVLATK